MTHEESIFIKAGVIGHPISHSKSPLIHNYWIAQHGLSGEYKAIDIAPEDLKDGIRKLIDEGYAGFNVTIPHKQEILRLCQSVDEKAKEIGAVNTVVIRNAQLHGTNTDAFGFVENIKHNEPLFDFSMGTAVVIGAGGAARAIVHGLLKQGVKDIIITNRTVEKAREIAAMNPSIIRVAAWNKRSDCLEKASLLVNTTALGMKGNDPLLLELDAMPRNAVVSDIVYSPLMTDLLMAAQTRGNPVVTGIGMLLHQARPAFEKWFGILPDVDAALQRKVLA